MASPPLNLRICCNGLFTLMRRLAAGRSNVKTPDGRPRVHPLGAEHDGAYARLSISYETHRLGQESVKKIDTRTLPSRKHPDSGRILDGLLRRQGGSTAGGGWRSPCCSSTADIDKTDPRGRRFRRRALRSRRAAHAGPLDEFLGRGVDRPPAAAARRVNIERGRVQPPFRCRRRRQRDFVSDRRPMVGEQ
jgi:hypothetical protein